MDQDFGRNRKTAQKGGYCNLLGFQDVQNSRYLKQIPSFSRIIVYLSAKA